MKKSHGFSLVETLIALFLFSTLLVAVTVFFVYYMRNYSFSFEANQSINLAQGAITNMIREIREARGAEDGAWPIVEAFDNSFTFYSDVTDDGRSDRVRYFLEGTTLKRGIVEPTTPPVTYPSGSEAITTIAESVNTAGAPIFTYYNGEWPSDTVNNPLSSANRQLNTRFVTVYVKIDIETNRGAQPYELTTGVAIRSMKDNL